jgi:hypothetical protein
MASSFRESQDDGVPLKQPRKYKTHNHELTEEYKRVTKQFKDLQVRLVGR